MQIGLMSLGDMTDDPVTGRKFSAVERYRMTIDAAVVADRVGLAGYFIGEHHGLAYTFSSPAVLLAAISERTTRLRLGTAVALAANLDPLRMVEDYATVDVISGGRVELVTGRGNFFVNTYELFGQSIDESAERFAESMELAAKLWPGEPIQWSGKFRPPITGHRLEPKPVQTNRIPFWVGGGSSPATAELAGRLGLNLMLPSAFGKPDKFIKIADIYREAFAKENHKHEAQVGASWHGWVGRTDEEAHKVYRVRYAEYHRFNTAMMLSVNPNPPPYLTLPFNYEFLTQEGPAIVGGPESFAERLSYLNELVGADLNIIKMDMAGVPRDEYLEMVERLGTEVLPLVNAAPQPAVAATA